MPLTLRGLVGLPPSPPPLRRRQKEASFTILSNFPNTSGHSFRRRDSLPRALIGGSATGIPAEQLVGGGEAKKRRSVAGVDQEELLDPEELADPDSSFFEFNGVRMHHKVYHHSEAGEEVSFATPGLPMILLHGFGASLFTWSWVMRPLARLAGSKVLAFDRPAFGLTSRKGHLERPSSGGGDAMPLNPYSMAFSVLATLSFIQLLGAQKAILMGHSAGCLVAVNAYFEAPERVAALILIAPAIIAPLVPGKSKVENRMGKRNQMEDGSLNSSGSGNPFLRAWRSMCELFMRVAGAALWMFRGMKEMIGSIYVKALSAVLRSAFAVMLVRMVMDKFGITAIRNAWYDSSQISDHVIQGYTKPLRSKGWEKALLEYTLAMITDSASKSAPPLSRRLAEISCPVLIITGDNDRLVPSWNAERLSRSIPGSTLEVIENCGHLPHEERVEEFLSAVERFLQRAFGVPEEQLAPASA